MEKFVNFAAGNNGRALRIVVGAALVYVALGVASGIWAWIVGVIAVALIASGAFGFCILNKLVKRPCNYRP